MSEINITIEGGTSKRLLTAGKYCDKDIVVTATGSDGGGADDIPAGYLHAGYIMFDGSQIVDTGIVCNQSAKIKSVYTRETSTSVYLYGVASTGNTAAVTAYLGGNWRFGSKYATRVITTSPDLIHTIIQDKTGIDGIASKNNYSGVTDFTAIGSLLIGTARNGNGTIGSAQFVGKVFLFELWQYGEEVRHMIPVVSTDGVYRFFDTVSQTFFDSITDAPLGGGNL
jgi:hypothetical protein